MNAIPTYDAIIVGGGPARSTCASILLRSGVNTLLLDRADFPRVKLCAGVISFISYSCKNQTFKDNAVLLTSASVAFNTLDDNKDYDTKLFITLSNSKGQIVTTTSIGDNTEFMANSNYPFVLTMHTKIF